MHDKTIMQKLQCDKYLLHVQNLLQNLSPLSTAEFGVMQFFLPLTQQTGNDPSTANIQAFVKGFIPFPSVNKPLFHDIRL